MKRWIRKWLFSEIASPVVAQGYNYASFAAPNASDLFFNVSPIDNGYIVSHGDGRTPVTRQHYVADLKEAGDFITARHVAHQLSE